MPKKLSIQIHTESSLKELTCDIEKTKNFISKTRIMSACNEVVVHIGISRHLFDDGFRNLLDGIKDFFNKVYLSDQNIFCIRNHYMSKSCDRIGYTLLPEDAYRIVSGDLVMKAEVPSALMVNAFIFKKFIHRYDTIDNALSYLFNECNFEEVLLTGDVYTNSRFIVPHGKIFSQYKSYCDMYELFSWVNFWEDYGLPARKIEVEGFVQKAKKSKYLCAYGDWYPELDKEDDKKSKKLKSRIEK